MVTEERVRELAYTLWEQDGRPQGKDQEHYYNARRVLEELEASQAEVAAKPAARKRSTGSTAKKTEAKAKTGSTSTRSTTRRRSSTPEA